MEINYQQKYLKYKAKYLELKRQIGGGEDCKFMKPARGRFGPIKCDCKFFHPPTKEGADLNICSVCKHSKTCHEKKC